MMRVIQLRIRAVHVYLLILFLYGVVMMISTTTNMEQLYETIDRPVPQIQDEYFSNLRKRKRVKRRVDLNDHLMPIKSVEDFFERLNQTETVCSKLVDIGGSSCRGSRDHNKLFCMDEDIIIDPKDCTVYSFGIGEDMTFDFEMNKYGCDVYMFDPTIPIDIVENNLRDNLQFFRYGIHTKTFNQSFQWEFQAKEDFKNTERNVTGTFDSFTNIQRRINHVGKVVHYLKMDIDGGEWYVIPHLIKNHNFDHVRQFAVEIHAMSILNKTNNEAVRLLREMWTVLHQLKDIGFERVSYTPTPVLENLYKFPDRNETVPTCGEILFLRRGANILKAY